MKKNYTITVEDNGSAFILVINKGTDDRLVIGAFDTLTKAWEQIEWLYKIETQEFTVGKNNTPVKEWLDCMRKIGYLE